MEHKAPPASINSVDDEHALLGKEIQQRLDEA